MKKTSRRDFLAASAAVGAAGVLTACGGSSSTAASTAGSAASTAAGGKSTDSPHQGYFRHLPLVCRRRHGLLPARILRGYGQEPGRHPDRR